MFSFQLLTIKDKADFFINSFRVLEELFCILHQKNISLFAKILNNYFLQAICHKKKKCQTF